jgi:hypothetical protein
MNLKTTIIVLVLVLAFGSVLVLSELQAKKDAEIRKKSRDIDINLCRDSGGIPVTSVWDGGLSDCIYPPTRK